MNQAQFSKDDWSDVTPIQQYDGQPPLLSPKYSEEYQLIMGYFRAIVLSEEISDRVYRLTANVIQLLPSNYNAYYIRRKCIQTLKLDLHQELEFINKLVDGNEKVYQIWEHRRQLIEWIKEYKDEFQFLKTVLDLDNKNYHAWSYRIWMCQYFDLFDQEIKAIDYFIEEDIGNNSAWNYRYFLKVNKQFDLQQELNFVYKQIQIKPDNEASWNYLRGWFKMYRFPQETENMHKSFKEFNILETDVKQFIAQFQQNRFALSLSIQIHLLERKKIEALEIANKLKEIDQIRCKYWEWMKSNIEKL